VEEYEGDRGEGEGEIGERVSGEMLGVGEGEVGQK
jgi:hypothetical protein